MSFRQFVLRPLVLGSHLWFWGPFPILPSVLGAHLRFWGLFKILPPSVLGSFYNLSSVLGPHLRFLVPTFGAPSPLLVPLLVRRWWRRVAPSPPPLLLLLTNAAAAFFSSSASAAAAAAAAVRCVISSSASAAAAVAAEAAVYGIGFRQNTRCGQKPHGSGSPEKDTQNRGSKNDRTGLPGGAPSQNRRYIFEGDPEPKVPWIAGSAAAMAAADERRAVDRTVWRV